MSELTKCNYCDLQLIKQQAAKRNAEVTLSRDEHGWIVVNVSDRDDPAAWMMSLSDRCVC